MFIEILASAINKLKLKNFTVHQNLKMNVVFMNCFVGAEFQLANTIVFCGFLTSAWTTIEIYSNNMVVKVCLQLNIFKECIILCHVYRIAAIENYCQAGYY